MTELALVIVVAVVASTIGFGAARLFEGWRLLRYYRNGGRR